MSFANGLPSGYTLTTAGPVYAIQYKAEAILQFENLSEHREGLSAEVTAMLMMSGESHWSRLTLAAPRSRAELAKRLNESLPGPPWAAILDVSPHAVTMAYRLGTPSQPVDSTIEIEDVPLWLIEGFVPMGKPTVFYGDGGKGKSLTALALGLSLLSGRPVGGSRLWTPATRLRSILYLDYEEDHATVTRLARALCRADALEVPDGLRYIRMTRPLADSLAQLGREVSTWGAEALIVDSWVPACGPMPETADASQRAFSALRALGGTSLLVAHVTKSAADGGGVARPFGSVMNSNLVRSAIEVTGSREGHTLSVTLALWKANRAPEMPPRNLTYTFSGPDPFNPTEIAVDIGEADVTRLPLNERIRAALRAAAPEPRTVTDLAEELDASEASIRQALHRDAKPGHVVRLVTGGAGKGQKTQWTLGDRNRDRL